jgi:hypothetical protein
MAPPQSSRPQADPREGWSLGDLLARASLDDEGGGGRPGAPAPAAAQPTAYPPAAAPSPLDIPRMARALDPSSASMIWGRLGAGQTGIMVRSIYTPDGRALFDEVFYRCNNEPPYRQAVDGFLGDFEQLLHDSEAQDPSGRTAQTHLVSDLGRVYLFLAHASGRLS